MLRKYEHSSLLGPFVGYEEKMCCEYGPWILHKLSPILWGLELSRHMPGYLQALSGELVYFELLNRFDALSLLILDFELSLVGLV
jgi:hypothetical protein